MYCRTAPAYVRGRLACHYERHPLCDEGRAIEAGELDFDGPIHYQMAARNAATLRAQKLEKELRSRLMSVVTGLS